MNSTFIESLTSRRLSETELDFRVEKCLPDLLWEQVLMRPDSTAVVYGQERLSYFELAESSLYLAAYLQHLGVAVDECIGIFVEPSLDLMVGVWGILFSGSAYLPLSPEYPEERLRYMVEDARVKIIFSQKKLKARLAELVPPGTRIVTLDDAVEFTTIQGITEKFELSSQLRQNNLAYIVYTSGSTGKPKGVMIEHRSIVNQMHWLQAAYKLNHESVVLQKTPMSFDAAQWEILAPSCGSTILSLVFSFFPATRAWASLLIGTLLAPLRAAGLALLDYLPNVGVILQVIGLTVMLTRFVHFVFDAVGAGKFCG